MRRKERSGPGIMNSDVATAGTLGLAESPALAYKQPQEKIEATTRMEKHRGDFTAGSSWSPRDITQPEHVAESRDGHSSARSRSATCPGLVIPGPDPKF